MSKRLLIWAGAFVLLLVGLGALYITPRSDEWYERQFGKRRHEMEMLVAILQTNQIAAVLRRSDNRSVLIKVSGDVGFAEASKSSPHGETLSRLFDAIGCDYASRDDNETIILLPRHGWADLYPGGYKAYAFRESPPLVLVKSIDEHRRRNRGQYGFYRQIEGGWFLKYEEAH
jgi:hypothetical protein